MKKIVLTGGGTAGHVTPNIALMPRLKELGYEIAQTQLSYPSQSPLEIAQAARLLFNQKYRWLKPVRAITVTGINLVSSNQNMQIDMFGDAQKRMRRQKLDDCIDEIRGRFGKNAIYSASLMGDLHMPGDDRHLVHMPGMMYS